jgi:hypothetical protein
MRWVWLLLLLTGCQAGGGQSLIQGQTPVVKSTGGGSSTLEITACAGPGGVEQVNQLLHMLSNAGLIVIGQNDGSARLAINICPFPPTGAQQ